MSGEADFLAGITSSRGMTCWGCHVSHKGILERKTLPRKHCLFARAEHLAAIVKDRFAAGCKILILSGNPRYNRTELTNCQIQMSENTRFVSISYLLVRSSGIVQFSMALQVLVVQLCIINTLHSNR